MTNLNADEARNAEIHAKAHALRDAHERGYVFSECDECFERHEVRGEPRPEDGYICPLNDAVYCFCDNEGEECMAEGIDAEYWDCPVYLREIEALRKEYGIEDEFTFNCIIL